MKFGAMLNGSRKPGEELSKLTRIAILAASFTGIKTRAEIARAYGITESEVDDTIKWWDENQATLSLEDSPKESKRKTTTAKLTTVRSRKIERAISRLVRNNPGLSTDDLVKLRPTGVSKHAIRKFLQDRSGKSPS